jgi:opacity protein-like surface antigen
MLCTGAGGAEKMQNIRCRTVVFITLILLVGLASGARGQEKSALFSIGGGFTAPNSEVRDHLGDGYNFNIGVQFNVTPVIGIEGLYSFNGLGQKQISIPVSAVPVGSGVPTDFFGDMNMQFGTANLVVQKPDGAVRPYGLVGMGVYYRPIKVTTPGVGFVPGYCSPWWYVCYPGGFVPVENIVGERSSTDFGMDFGGGVNFGVVFAELRYHYIWGPTIEPVTVTPLTTPTDLKANGQFIALTFGVRF